jgi:hypothetical protein
MASFEHDGWRLRSGEESNAKYPDSFQIPSATERSGLTPGVAAKIIFEIEVEHSDGSVVVESERTWVIVKTVESSGFIGILDNHPVSFDYSDDAYLCFGCEVPFASEHVIDIAFPPQAYVDWQFSMPPEKIWPRGPLAT